MDWVATIEDVHIKKVDRSGFLDEVAQPHNLQHVETQDKSAPAIGDATVQTSNRPALLEEIKKQ